MIEEYFTVEEKKEIMIDKSNIEKEEEEKTTKKLIQSKPIQPKPNDGSIIDMDNSSVFQTPSPIQKKPKKKKSILKDWFVVE